METLSKLIAEFTGTGLMMFGGCSGCLAWGKEPVAFFGAISFGLTVMMLIQCYGAVSGAHFNPAVTLAAIIFKLISVPVSHCAFLVIPLWSFVWHFSHFIQTDGCSLFLRAIVRSHRWIWFAEGSHASRSFQWGWRTVRFLYNCSTRRLDGISSVHARVHCHNVAYHTLLLRLGSTQSQSSRFGRTEIRAFNHHFVVHICKFTTCSASKWD